MAVWLRPKISTQSFDEFFILRNKVSQLLFPLTRNSVARLTFWYFQLKFFEIFNFWFWSYCHNRSLKSVIWIIRWSGLTLNFLDIGGWWWNPHFGFKWRPSSLLMKRNNGSHHIIQYFVLASSSFWCTSPLYDGITEPQKARSFWFFHPVGYFSLCQNSWARHQLWNQCKFRANFYKKVKNFIRTEDYLFSKITLPS